MRGFNFLMISKQHQKPTSRKIIGVQTPSTGTIRRLRTKAKTTISKSLRSPKVSSLSGSALQPILKLSAQFRFYWAHPSTTELDRSMNTGSYAKTWGIALRTWEQRIRRWQRAYAARTGRPIQQSTIGSSRDVNIESRIPWHNCENTFINMFLLHF